MLPVTAFSKSRRAYGDGGRGKKRQTCSLGLWRTVQTSGGAEMTTSGWSHCQWPDTAVLMDRMNTADHVGIAYLVLSP